MGNFNVQSYNAHEFLQELRREFGRATLADKPAFVSFSAGLAPGPGRGYIKVNFYNLPEYIFQKRRGGGAEAENNRMTFMITGFGETEHAMTDKLTIEQLVNNIGGQTVRAPKMRKKTDEPIKISYYLSNYLHKVATEFRPNLTHE